MTHDLRPYPAYKDSGVPWLGDVPRHWEIRPLKRWVDINAAVLSDATPPDFEFDYIDIGTVGTGVLNEKPKRIRFAGAPSRARRVLRRGDTIISTVRTYLKAVYFVNGDADALVCSTGFAVLTPQPGTEPEFVSYLVRSSAFTDCVTAESVGTAYPAIAEGHLGSFHVPVPPAEEQAAIVRFLDHVDRKIRRYIRAKRQLIALLDEQKQAVIHRAVTRGLDPNVRLKPSGVEWLGEVPEHWEVRRCRYLCREVDNRSADGSEEHLSMSQRLGLVPSHLVQNRTLVSESYAGGKLCAVGDLVLNRLKAHLGVFALAQHAGVISPDYTVLRPIDPRGAEYFEQVLRSPACRHELRIRAKGIVEGFWRLYTDDFYDIRLPVPPAAERIAILEHNRMATGNAETTTTIAEREIGLLREYRTRLIADVVTGKLDVRKAAARLPDEPDALEPLEEAEALLEEAEEGGEATPDALLEEAAI